MGDRCHANLTLFGIATREDMKEIYGAISRSQGINADTSRDALEGPRGSLDLDEVDDRELDGGILNAIQEAGLGYIWTWDGGHEYGTGLEFIDPRSQSEPAVHDTLHGEIALTVSDAEDPDIMSYMVADKNALTHLRTLPLRITDSAHETIEILAKHPDLKGFDKTV